MYVPNLDLIIAQLVQCRWTRVPLVPEHNNSNTRSHTCHAVGSQLLIVGGYPLVEEVDREAPCEKEFVKVLELSDVGVCSVLPWQDLTTDPLMPL